MSLGLWRVEGDYLGMPFTSVKSMCSGLREFWTRVVLTATVLAVLGFGGMIPSFFARRLRMIGL